jgi:hypothetical protein
LPRIEPANAASMSESLELMLSIRCTSMPTSSSRRSRGNWLNSLCSSVKFMSVSMRPFS